MTIPIRVILVILLTQFSTYILAVSITASGSIPRGDVSQMALQVTLKNVPLADLLIGRRERVQQSLKIYLFDHPDGGRPIQYQSTSINEVYLESYEIELGTIEHTTSTDLLTETLSIAMTIRDNNAATNDFPTLLEDGFVTISATYIDPLNANETALVPNIDISQDKGVVNQRVEGLTPAATHKSIILSWTNESDVAFNAEQPDSRHSGVNIFLVDLSIHETYDFLGKTYKEDPSSEITDATCSFSLTDAETCKIEDCKQKESETAESKTAESKTQESETAESEGEAEPYLDKDSLGDVQGIQVLSVNREKSSATFAELDETKKYAMFAQYRPSGLLLSECLVMQPVKNVTLTELNGAKEATAGRAPCFIATAAYGSELHPSLFKLRWFRDHFLMGHALGRFFVKNYYKYSPKLAQKISQSENLKLLVRALLWPIVLYVDALYFHFYLTLMISLFAAWFLIIKITSKFPKRAA